MKKTEIIKLNGHFIEFTFEKRWTPNDTASSGIYRITKIDGKEVAYNIPNTWNMGTTYHSLEEIISLHKSHGFMQSEIEIMLFEEVTPHILDVLSEQDFLDLYHS